MAEVLGKSEDAHLPTFGRVTTVLLLLSSLLLLPVRSQAPPRPCAPELWM
jgi:hypothetical protein